MKRAFLLAFVILVIIPVAAFAEFMASKKSDKYHYPSCKWAMKIKSTNLVKFSTAQDAIKAGYIPCKVCRPPSR